MKYLLLTSVMTVAVVMANAQQTDNTKPIGKQKEIGLIFSDLNNFGITYKTGYPRHLWRFTSVLGNGFNSNTSLTGNEIDHSGFNLNFSVGREYRKFLSDNFQLRTGMELTVGAMKNKTVHSTITNSVSQEIFTESQNSQNVGVKAIVGFNYLIGDNILIGLEVLPGITYSSTKAEYISNLQQENNNTSETGAFSYGFSNQGALLTIAYRF